VFIDEHGRLHAQQFGSHLRHTPCIFEYVYFARPDSIIDKISVYRARMRMGDKLAEKILRVYPHHDIDVVIPIPDTSRTSAMQVALKLGLKYREGFIKNRYIARKVYFASAAPPVRFPNVYGIDMPAASELVASERTVEEVASLIGADWLIYQDLEDLVAACRHDDARIEEFDTSCFSGEYVTGDVTPEYLEKLRLERSDEAKSQRRDERGPFKIVSR